MAFSFRAGTNWCHDFPKLARESGFCFNVHRSRVRVDWNRISSIDIDRVIRERDFLTVDDNVNNVVDYSLESEYDVKILDPNFVKLFRLAQLSVEYLLYCKQYLDHSVIILKDELRSKIEDNATLKKKIETSQETINNLNQKMKERNKIIESKLGDSSGELFKCPHCTKTFIAPTFVSAHIARRHAHLSDPYMMSTSSPMHEQYRAETEKLHNEIKTLKERLNQTERVIKNESDKTLDYSRLEMNYKRPDIYEKGEYTSEIERDERLKEQQKKYQDEIASLKNMLFTEIKNLKQKDVNGSSIYQLEHETNIMNLKELIKKQEKEIHTLRDQLREKLTPDLKDLQEKLQLQEQHWKVLNDRLEKQHKLDTENLSIQLKISQEAAKEMKELYESKVNELEMHSKNQKKILESQGIHLKKLSHELWESREISQKIIREPINDSQNKSSSRNIINKVPNIRDIENDYRINAKNNKHDELVCEELGGSSSHESSKLLTSPKRDAKISSQHENHTNLLSGSGDFETSEDTESIGMNNKHEKSIRNFSKLTLEETLNIRDNKRTLTENFNLASLNSSRSEKTIRHRSQKNNYPEAVETFKTSPKDQIKKNRKHPQQINSSNLKDSHTSARNKNSNQDSKIVIRSTTSQQDLHSYETKLNEKISSEKFSTKLYTPEKSMEESEESDDYSETESESITSKSESETVSDDESTEKLKRNSQSTETLNSRENFRELKYGNLEKRQEIRQHLIEVFDNKLKDLGIDPEWNGIPNATFKQKMETVAHHRNINSKKISCYNRIRQKILKEILHKLLEKKTELGNSEKISPLNKIISKVKNKTANVLKHQKSFESRKPVLKSQLMTPRDKTSRPTSNLEILPKKMTQSDIHEMRSKKSSESLQKREPEFQPNIRPISVRNMEISSQIKSGIFSQKHNTETINHSKVTEKQADSTSLEKLSESHDNIEYLSENDSTSKAKRFTSQSKSTKVTSTPNKLRATIVEQSYLSVDNESENDLINEERAHSLPTSPKNNRSVLKSTTGSVGSLVKKKVLFDLERSLENDGKSPNKDVTENRSVKKLYPEYDFQGEEINDNDWNISNISDENDTSWKEKTPSVENIILKTSQSEKIARISQKIQDQLSIARQKPVGAIEAMFLAKHGPKEGEKDNTQYRSSTSITSSILESPKNEFPKQLIETNKYPKPAPRTPKKHESDIESDIEELLQLD